MVLQKYQRLCVIFDSYAGCYQSALFVQKKTHHLTLEKEHWQMKLKVVIRRWAMKSIGCHIPFGKKRFSSEAVIITVMNAVLAIA